jgi:class 3 adenylate cyclase
MHEIASWLAGLGLGKFAAKFAEAEIDAASLRELTDEHLKELGMPLGARLKLLKTIRELDTGAVSGSTQAERRQLTVMFVDLAGSTELSLKLDPEELRDLSRPYQDATERDCLVSAGHRSRVVAIHWGSFAFAETAIWGITFTGGSSVVCPHARLEAWPLIMSRADRCRTRRTACRG